MSMGGGASSGNSQSATTLDPQIKGDWESLLGQAQTTAGQPTPQQQIAAFNPTEQAAIGQLTQAGGAGAGAIQNAVNAATGLTSYHAPTINMDYQGVPLTTDASHYSASTYKAQNAATQVGGKSVYAGPASTYNAAQARAPDGSVISYNDVNAPQFSADQLRQYEDPYTSDVINTTMNQLDLARQQAINGNSSSATLAGGQGAWNGSRAGVSDALTNTAFGQQAASTAASLNSANYDQAATQALNYNQMGLAAQQSNQNADLSKGLAVYGGDLSTNLSNQAATDAARQFNSSANNQVNLYNAGEAGTLSLADQAAINSARQFDSSALNTAGQFNASADNTASMFNATQAYNAQNANAGYDLAGEQARAQAAGLLGTLGTTQQNNAITGANAVLSAGQTQQQYEQSQADAAYNNAMNARNLPLQTVESAFGILPSTGSGSSTTSHSSGKSGQVGIG